jgi:uncharacterized glyoxalase superfamily protein PhnB
MAAKKKKAAKKKAVKAQGNKRPVRPVPRGYGTVTASMTPDDAAATIGFCKKAFGAKVMSKMMGPGKKIMHAEVMIGDSIVMVADPMMGPARASSLFLYVPNVDKVVAKAVKAGAKVKMPVADMFWGDRYGVLEDPQGNQWEIATRVENVKPDEVKRRAKAEFKRMAKG